LFTTLASTTPLPLSTWPKAHHAVSSHRACPATTVRFPCTSHHSASQRPLCASLTHVIESNGPSCQDPDEGQDGPSCRQTCQHDGLLGYVEVGSRPASCLDKVAVLAWVADVPPAVGCIAATPSLDSLDQGLLGHSTWDEVCICLGLSDFSFHTGTLWALGAFLEGHHAALGYCFYWICPLFTPTPCQHWGFSGRAIMWPQDVVLLGLCPLVTPTPYWHWGFSGRGIMWPRDVVY